MNTSRKALSIAFAATLAGGVSLGTAGIATASGIQMVSSPVSVAMTTQTADVVITIDDFTYNVSGPVSPGATVTVVNNDDVPHTVTDPDGAFDTGIFEAGATVTFTAPSEPGEYSIVCTIHPNMSGALVVEAAQSGPAPQDDDDAAQDDAAADAQDDTGTGQVSPMPEGGADTGAVQQENGTNLAGLALGGGLVLAAGAVGGTYVVRRAANRA